MKIHVILLFLLGKIMTAFALVPSQVPGACSYARPKQKDETALYANNNDGDSEAGDEVVYNPLPSEQISSATSTTTSSYQRTKKKRYQAKTWTGNLPDVHWRAISMTHLRSHPNFQPLPPPSMIHQLPTKEHVRYFRQDSWQWDYLHTGRCTTSQCSAVLGFLEPKAAKYLGIPKSLQRGGGGAWDRLSQIIPQSLESLEAMEQMLCEGRSSSPGVLLNIEEVVGTWRPRAKESDRLWIPSSRLPMNAIRTKPFPFSAKYIPNSTYQDLYQRKLFLQQHHGTTPSPMKTRMQWGNAQEATSILTALNYFCGLDNRTMIHEVGMCGAKFDDELDLTMQGVKIGASPDALIYHGDGTVEVLEVKNHCPVVRNKISQHYNTSKTRGDVQSSNNKNRKRNKGKTQTKKKKDDDDDNNNDQQGRGDDGIPKYYMIRDFQLERKIPPIYIPQLMMEMLCVGDNCNAATMVRQTATKGAILLRLKRCESWITEMKYWLGRFQSEYVDTGIVPHDNFFWDNDRNGRYRKFLETTKELSESVEHVAFINHGRIQRMVMERGVRGEVPLFLDSVVDQEVEES